MYKEKRITKKKKRLCFFGFHEAEKNISGEFRLNEYAEQKARDLLKK